MSSPSSAEEESDDPIEFFFYKRLPRLKEVNISAKLICLLHNDMLGSLDHGVKYPSPFFDFEEANVIYTHRIAVSANEKVLEGLMLLQELFKAGVSFIETTVTARHEMKTDETSREKAHIINARVELVMENDKYWAKEEIECQVGVRETPKPPDDFGHVDLLKAWKWEDVRMHILRTLVMKYDKYGILRE